MNQIYIGDRTDQGWACTTTSWVELELLVKALHNTGPFLAMVMLVDGAFERIENPQDTWLVSDGSKIAVRSYQPDSAKYVFFGREMEQSEVLLVVVGEDPESDSGVGTVEVPKGLMLDPSDAIRLLEQRITGATDLPMTVLPR